MEYESLTTLKESVNVIGKDPLYLKLWQFLDSRIPENRRPPLNSFQELFKEVQIPEVLNARRNQLYVMRVATPEQLMAEEEEARTEEEARRAQTDYSLTIHSSRKKRNKAEEKFKVPVREAERRKSSSKSSSKSR